MNLNALVHDALTASRWFFRSLRQGDWLWLILAVALASLSVTTVDLLAKTVKQSMLREAANQLGADLVLRSTRPLNPDWQTQAQGLGLQTATSTSLVTMASHNDEFQLVQLKGISDNFPLRGQLKTQSLNADAMADKTTNNPTIRPLVAWIETPLLDKLKLTAPNIAKDNLPKITLGTAEFKVTATVQPSGFAVGMSSFAHQIWIRQADLAATHLIGPGSRVSYELAVAGNAAAIQQFSQSIQSQLDTHTQLISAQAPNEDLAKSLDTAWIFLDLAALAAILVAGLSILIASRFYLQRWQNSMALMRALGATSANILAIFTLQLTLLGLIASAMGILLGWLGFQLLLPLLHQYFDNLVQPAILPTLVKGFVVGLLVLWSFTWQAFQKALTTSPLSLFRTLKDAPSFWHWGVSLLLILLLLGLMTQSASPQQVGWILLGLIGVGVLLYLTSVVLLWLIARLQTRATGWFKLSLAALAREPGLVKIQLISLGLVLFVLMLLTFVRQDLMQTWQASLPADTPDTFVMNVQPEQLGITQDLLTAAQIDTPMVPMIKGRLTAINNLPLLASEQTNPRAKRLLERESNIALLDEPPSYNQMLAQLADDDSKRQPALPKVSVEQGMADLFKIQLGDVLHFNLSGTEFATQVTSLRKVEWQSFRLNFFFIIAPPKDSDTLPISYISSFKMPEETPLNPLQKSLAEQVPGVLLIDVKRILHQIQTIMGQASWAVSGLTLFTLLASILVLLSATQASQQTRVQSWMLLKTLGAQQATLVKIGLMEFALLGGFAGLMAASLAQAASVILSLVMLKIEPSINPSLWLTALGSGVFGLLAIGWLTQRHYIRQSPKALSRYE